MKKQPDANDVAKKYGPAELRDRTDKAIIYEQQQNKNVRSNNGAGGKKAQPSNDWPEPDMTILEGARIAPPKLDVSVFGSLEPILRTIAEHKGAPIDAAALALLVSASALIGVKRRAKPHPAWIEPCMLWGGLVMPPSQNKSPILDPFKNAIEVAEKYLSRGFDDRHRRWEADRKAAQLTREKWEKDVKEALDKGYAPPPLPETAEEPPEPLKPTVMDCGYHHREDSGAHGKSPRRSARLSR